MIRLFLYDKFEDATKEYEVELKEDIQISITKQFTDLSNPTAIINDWSKTVAIPFTQKNNEIFGCLFRADRTVTAGAPVGQFDFDPTKKVQFRLFNDSNLIMAGYMKVLNVEQKSSVVGSYNVTLNGELGRIFQIMKNITFDNSRSTEDGYIDGKQYIDEYINAELIKKCWESQIYTINPTLLHVNDENYDITNYITFAPNNAFSDDFDYKSYECYTTDRGYFFDTFENELQYKWDLDNFTTYKAEQCIPNGITPRGISEFRSYLQIPAIYFHKLFGIFQEKAEEITGYTFDLDNGWFSEANMYWFDQIFCLNNFNLEKDEASERHYTMQTTWKKITQGTSTWNYHDDFITNQIGEGQYPYSFSNRGFWLTENWSFNANSTFKLAIKFTKAGQYTQGYDLGNQSIFVFTLYYRDFNNQTIKSENFYIVGRSFDTSTPVPSNSTKLITDHTEYIYNADTDETTITIYTNIPITTPLYTYFFNNASGVKYYIEFNFFNHYSMIDITVDSIDVQFQGSWNIYKTPNRSFTKFTLNDIWNNDYNLFDVILNYCKKYRIFIEVDDLKKKIYFISAKKYFKYNSVEDWTGKIDYSKNWKLDPYVAESKYLLFNYNNNESKINKIYKNDTGLNFGELRAETDFNFNEDTANLFNNLNGGFTYKSNYLPWDWLYELDNMNSTTSEIFICNAGENNKQISVFGQYFLINDREKFQYTDDPRYEHRPISITDDTINQIMNDFYCFNQTPEKYDCTTDYYTKLTIMNSTSDYLITFGKPVKSYAEDILSHTEPEYNIFWKQYFDDIYNINTKKIMCYVRLNDDDFKNFKFNKFVQINNTLYFVNKIQDYQLNKNESTKVELVSINNPTNYYAPSMFFWVVAYSKLKDINITSFPVTVEYDIVGYDLSERTFEAFDIKTEPFSLDMDINYRFEKIDQGLQKLYFDIDYAQQIRPGQTYTIKAKVTTPPGGGGVYDLIQMNLHIVE